MNFHRMKLRVTQSFRKQCIKLDEERDASVCKDPVDLNINAEEKLLILCCLTKEFSKTLWSVVNFRNFNPSSANSTKWSNTLRQFIGNSNARFSENLACFVFLLLPFWYSPSCLTTNESMVKIGILQQVDFNVNFNW